MNALFVDERPVIEQIQSFPRIDQQELYLFKKNFSFLSFQYI